MRVNPKFNYVLDYFRRAYGCPESISIGHGTVDCHINIADRSAGFFDSDDLVDEKTVVWREYQGRSVPFLFGDIDKDQPVSDENGRAFIHDDILAAAFYFLSGWQEHRYMSRHSVPRYPFEESFQAKHNTTFLPVVNYYFLLLVEAIEQITSTKLKASFWADAPYAICLTHDIDNIRAGWIRDAIFEARQLNLRNAAQIVSRRLKHNNHWTNIREIVDLEAEYGAISSFYFIGQSGFVYPRSRKDGTVEPNPSFDTFFSEQPRSIRHMTGQRLPAADYDVEEPTVRTLFEIVRHGSAEVGIHGGFGSHVDAERFGSELAKFTGKIIGGRFHYLYFDITRTFDLLVNQQIQYDSTLGFAEAAGFRNGICWPFAPYDFNRDTAYPIIEIPLAAMDTTFRLYQGLRLEQILPEVEILIEECRRFNGCLTVLWHNSYFSPYKFAGWQSVYEQILLAGKQDGALMTSGEVILSNFLKS